MANPNREGEVPTERDRNGSELPEGWETANLRALTEVLDNQRIPVNSEERKRRQGDVPYFGATGQVGWIDDFLFDDEILLIGEDGAPFFDKSKPIAYIVRGKSWVNNHAHVLKANVATSNLYLKYFLDWFDFNGFVNGTTRLKLTQAAMNTIPVRTPPLAEQHRIVAKLEELLGRVSRAKARLDRIPALLKRFRQSVLAAACSGKLTADWREGDRTILSAVPVTIGRPDWLSQDTDSLLPEWQCRVLADVAKLESGHTPRKTCPEYWKDGDVPWISLQDIREANGKEITCTKLMPNMMGIENSSARLLPKGTVVFSRDISVGYVTIMGKEMATTQHFANWICGPELYNCFLMFALMASRESLVAMGQGSTVGTIYMPALKEFHILLPPLPEQKEIVRRVEDLFAFANQIEARLTKAQAQVDRLTQSILAKAFRGELVPTEAELARREGRDYEPASKLLERVRSSKDVEIGTGKKRRNRPTTRRKVSP